MQNKSMVSKFSLYLMIFNLLALVFLMTGPKKRPATSWAWFFMLFALPIGGMIVYLLFGLDSKNFKAFLRKSEADETLTKQTNITNTLTTQNEIDIYHEGEEKFENLIHDIKNATETIYIQYYILQNDQLGRRIINILAEKAEQGVSVNLLIDKLGSRRISKKMMASLVKKGGNLVFFTGPKFFGLNYRNHRKICVIDGKIGYIGGFNIGNEYMRNHWRDCHIRIRGEAVDQLTLRFIQDYNYCAKDKIVVPINKQVQSVTTSEPINNPTKLQMIASGPDTKDHEILYAYLDMMNKAKRYIYIQTPYFIPHESVLDGLKLALKNGVDVRIMIPSKPDHPLVKPAGISYLGQLIHYGAKCYAYEKGFVHSKLVIIDDQVASVGTANMDIRSLTLNFEINAMLYDEAKAKELANQFLIDIAYSQFLDYNWYSSRSKTEKMKENLCRLISPVL